MSKRVTVLMGGYSSEREVSLSSGKAAVEHLSRAGYAVEAVDVPRDLTRFLPMLVKTRPDVVFNALHGRYGEDGCIQGLLDIMGIPYTHSGRLASALAMDKPMAKRLFVQAGIPVAESAVTGREQVLSGDPMPRPYVLKPLNEGSSVGVHVVLPGDSSPPFRAADWPYGERVMVERYVPGRELTVAVMGERALGVLEIRPREGFYDYAAKYTAGKADHLVPAPLPGGDYEVALALALEAHRTLGCRGVSRADLRYDDARPEGERFAMLEINTQPGMTPLSLVPEIAAHAGIAFPELVRWMVEEAACDA